VSLNTGFLAAALGVLGAFVFTAGIGESSPSMRARIAEKTGWRTSTSKLSFEESPAQSSQFFVRQAKSTTIAMD